MVKVKVTQGWLEGEVLETVTGDRKYYSFKGIPYAEPPLGKLRFKAPRPALPWEGVKKATQHGPVCPQVDIFTEILIPGSEDCLYLNVYTPEINSETLLPVMFFIHGGGYKSGSGNVDNYGPDFLVAHGIVLVTINYRLDALGFLCLDTEEVPGNAGLKDQVAALKWVKENISSFGGDPDNITVFGESAGGASTSFHVISPMSKGLFKRVISMSGVLFCDWSIAFEPRRRAFKLGQLLGIETENPDELLEYLQNVPVEKLVNTDPNIITMEELHKNMLKFYHFTPVVEKDFGQEHFLAREPIEVLKHGNINDVDMLLGFTNEEAIIGITLLEKHLVHLYNKYIDLFAPRLITIKATPDKVLEISDRIRHFYFGNKKVNLESMREFVTFVNDCGFIYPIHRFAGKLSDLINTKVFMYKFSMFSNRNVYGAAGANYKITGASHLEDLMYLFDAKKFDLKIETTSREYRLINLACTIFTNFAKFGNPTPDTSLGVKWPEYNKETRKYCDIGDELTIGLDNYRQTVDFWKKVYEDAGLEF